jgi:aminoglycoside phosphotransferase family enzyme
MTHPKLVETMLKPDFYPHKPENIELIQTHISYIFIAGDLVYKVKKAVDFGFLDFTTLGKRKYYCDEEVRLNQRFAHGVYLDVVRIIEDSEGNLHLSNGSNIVEYAVEMKKIPENRMLYRLLEGNKVSPDDMRRVGRYLAEVYGHIPASEKSREFGGLDVIATNVIENFDQTRKYIGGPVSDEKFTVIETWSRAFMKNNADLFERRIAEGQIKDCHGDLHLQHICLENDKIFIFDCIEFNERFRFGDVASDVAFLSMDFDYNGKSTLGDSFIEAYITAAGDTTMRDVLLFYKVYRAYVRAKVTSFLLDDEDLDDTTRNNAFQKAAKYYDLAYEYITHEN